MTDPADIITAARSLHSAVERLLAAAARNYGINRTDLGCLEILDRNGPLTATRLAELADLSPAAMTKILRRLEVGGFIEVHASDGDRRQRIATTLDRHVSVRSSTWRAVVADVGERFKGLSPEATAALVEGMTVIAEIGEHHSHRLQHDVADRRPGPTSR